MRKRSDFARELEKLAIDWMHKEPLGTVFQIDMYEYIATKLKEKYEIKEKV